MLHITNGDSAVPPLRAAGVEGDVLPWREVLHDGPVPGGLDAAALRQVRARFLAPRAGLDEAAVLADMEVRDARLETALASGEEVVLWFEADLFDVLLLVQVLARIPDRAGARLVLVGQDPFRHLTQVEPAELAALGRDAPRVTVEQFELARDAWRAFTGSDPRGIERLAGGTHALPAVGQALRRLLEDLPWTTTGLGRTEAQLLAALANGAADRTEAFLAAANAEERPFLGDTSAFATLDRLAPLLDGDALNERGGAVLAGREMWEPPHERWIGGTRLPAGRQRWRWDPAAERLVDRPPAAAVTNADVLRGHFRAFGSGGLDAVSEFWHPDIEWRAVEGAADDVGVMRGHAALRRYYQDWIDTLDDLRAEVEEVVLDADDRIAAAVRNSGRGRASGVPVEGRYYVACIVRGGQIVTGAEYGTRRQALEAVAR